MMSYEPSLLVDRAIEIVMHESACDADVATSRLAGSASAHHLPVEEVAAAVVAVAFGTAGYQ